MDNVPAYAPLLGGWNTTMKLDLLPAIAVVGIFITRNAVTPVPLVVHEISLRVCELEFVIAILS